jgi:flagellar protein FlbD
MIQLHRLNGDLIVVNTELIESILSGPDTVILMATGNRIVVKESIDEVIERAVAYRQTVYKEASPYLPKLLKGKELPGAIGSTGKGGSESCL